MSLIPSESYSFPDHFTTTVTPSRKPKNAGPKPVPLETRQKRPLIVALPAPTMENGSEQASHSPPVALAQNVIPMKRACVARLPQMMPPAESLVPQKPLPTTAPKLAPIAKAQRPAQAPMVTENPRPVAASNPQADFFEMFAQGGETALSKRRRKTKMRRFIVCESVVVAILLPLAIFGLSHRPDNAALLWIMNISTVASAVAAALIPIVFFAFTPSLREIER